MDNKINNFGFLRLFFATLVIFGHSPEIIDGNRSRELLTQVFGTLSLGELSVDAFFIISGFLISKSFRTSPSVWSYIIKRSARILPGFIVCFALCLFVLAPLVEGQFGPGVISTNVKSFIRMTTPLVPGTFPGLPYPSLNGSLWTIGYEFRCYMLVILIGLLGLLSDRGRWLVLAIAAICLAINAFSLVQAAFPNFGQAQNMAITVRFTGLFLAGACFYLFGSQIAYKSSIAVIMAILLIAGLFVPTLAEAAIATAGAYLIFYFAFAVRPLRISQWAAKNDISYGLYLYAWPIQISIVYVFGVKNHWLVSVVSLLIVSVIAAASWLLIERPFQRLSHGKTRRAAPPVDYSQMQTTISSERNKP